MPTEHQLRWVVRLDQWVLRSWDLRLLHSLLAFASTWILMPKSQRTRLVGSGFSDLLSASLRASRMLTDLRNASVVRFPKIRIIGCKLRENSLLALWWRLSIPILLRTTLLQWLLLLMTGWIEIDLVILLTARNIKWFRRDATVGYGLKILSRLLLCHISLFKY